MNTFIEQLFYNNISNEQKSNQLQLISSINIQRAPAPTDLSRFASFTSDSNSRRGYSLDFDRVYFQSKSTRPDITSTTTLPLNTNRNLIIEEEQEKDSIADWKLDFDPTSYVFKNVEEKDTSDFTSTSNSNLSNLSSSSTLANSNSSIQKENSPEPQHVISKKPSGLRRSTISEYLVLTSTFYSTTENHSLNGNQVILPQKNPLKVTHIEMQSNENISPKIPDSPCNPKSNTYTPLSDDAVISSLTYLAASRTGREEKIGQEWAKNLQAEDVCTVGDARLLSNEDWNRIQGLSVFASRAIRKVLEEDDRILKTEKEKENVKTE